MLKLGLALVFVVMAWLALLFFTGIAPWPHLSNLTPPVLGEFTNSAGPLAATPIRVVRREGGKTCSGPLVEATTETNGRFALPAVRELNWVIVVMGHRRFEWDLCVEIDEQWHLAKSYGDYSLVDTGPEQVAIIRCKVDRPDGAGPRFQCEEDRNWGVTEDAVARWLRAAG